MTLEQLSSGAQILKIDHAFFLVYSSLRGDHGVGLRKGRRLDVQSFFFANHLLVMVFVLVLLCEFDLAICFPLCLPLGRSESLFDGVFEYAKPFQQEGDI